MKIYDCFMFFNELEILKLRLQELYEYVDYFVLVEANKTFSGKDKEFIFEKNRNMFKEWEDKIIYIKVEDMPSLNKLGVFIQTLGDKVFFDKNRNPRKNLLNKIFPIRGFIIHLGIGRWKPQFFQRNAIMRGLKECEERDIIIISDVDEIPNYKKFLEMKNQLKTEKRIGFIQKEFNYYLNGLAKEKWIGAKACKFSGLKKLYKCKPQKLRGNFLESRTFRKMFNLKEMILIKNGGWHFSYIGNAEKIKEKFSSMAGSITLKTDLKKIKEKLKKGELVHKDGEKINYVPVDDSFPEALRKNIKEYSHLIKNV